MEDTVQNVNQNTNQNANQNPAPINFDPRTLKENYSDSEWAVKEAWYPKILAQITIPADNPTSAHLQKAVVGLDIVAGVAFIDAARAESNYLRYDQLMKVEEGNAYVAVQNGQTGSSIQNKAKLSIDDTKALVTQYLSSHPYDNTQYNIYELVNISRERREFMRNIIKLIEGKKDMFITTSANLKLDSTISGMTPSVPQQNNYPNMYQRNRSDHGDING